MASAATVREVAGAVVQQIPIEDLASHLPTLEQELGQGSIELTRENRVVATIIREDRGARAAQKTGKISDAFGILPKLKKPATLEGIEKAIQDGWAGIR